MQGENFLKKVFPLHPFSKTFQTRRDYFKKKFSKLSKA
jgi:hypothetical protein